MQAGLLGRDVPGERGAGRALSFPLQTGQPQKAHCLMGRSPWVLPEGGGAGKGSGEGARGGGGGGLSLDDGACIDTMSKTPRLHLQVASTHTF